MGNASGTECVCMYLIQTAVRGHACKYLVNVRICTSYFVHTCTVARMPLRYPEQARDGLASITGEGGVVMTLAEVGCIGDDT